MSVSIVIPTYKRADYLDRLLHSISIQTYQNFEVIVIDDNSPNYEEYLPVVKKYTNIFDSFTVLRNDTNKGTPHSRNRGILKSKYDLIALVDDDDEWLPLKLEKQVEVFNDNSPNVGIVYTWTDVISEQRNVIHEYRSDLENILKKEILKECFIPSPSIMVRKEAIIKAGLFDESFPSCQDWDMWTRIIMKGYEVKVVKEVLTLYNKHSGESIGLSTNATLGYVKYYKKHFLQYLQYTSFSEIYKVIKFLIYRLIMRLK